MKERYIRAAKIATIYVADALPYGPANVHRFGCSPQPGAGKRVVALQKSLQKFALKRQIGQGNFAEHKEAYFAKVARKALEHRAGNCDAMGALAYRFLLTSPGIRPLVHHSLQNPQKSDGHTFVTIDQTNRGAEIASWSEADVVICDPWLSYIHIQIPGALSDTFNADELMGVYTVSRFVKFMTDLGYYGGGEVELFRADT